MATAFEVREAPTQNVLSIRETCAMRDIGPTVGRVFPEVIAWAQAHGVKVLGPAFTQYVDMSKGRCTFEAGFVVDRLVETADPRVHGGILGGGRAVFGLHVGEYEALAGTYAELQEWSDARHLAPAAPMWEAYLDGPEVPAKERRTEVWCPVKNGASS